MPHRQAYVERDRHGRERLVLGGGRRRSSSADRISAGELLTAAQARIQTLEIELGQLQTRLSFEQSGQWNSRRERDRLTAENYQLQGQLQVQVQEVTRMEDLLFDEEERNKKLEEKYRLMKRSRSRSRSGSSEYRRAYEEKAQEVEILRVRLAEKDEILRLNEGRLAEKDRALREKNVTISYFKDYLQTHGFRVQDR
ncbi:hypothetical protein LSUE1_G006766 [Lachnellula suecica]|uniref:Uncharacterized protein n=1 Tax=Lachnellula suecica TaxID=602035 RepID=A0A8T9CBW3_9HELO|nr:hypothetical protein LSUE1_G006766 [Lachnellula suecica]